MRDLEIKYFGSFVQVDNLSHFFENFLTEREVLFAKLVVVANYDGLGSQIKHWLNETLKTILENLFYLIKFRFLYITRLSLIFCVMELELSC